MSLTAAPVWAKLKGNRGVWEREGRQRPPFWILVDNFLMALATLESLQEVGEAAQKILPCVLATERTLSLATDAPRLSWYLTPIGSQATCCHLAGSRLFQIPLAWGSLGSVQLPVPDRLASASLHGRGRRRVARIEVTITTPLCRRALSVCHRLTSGSAGKAGGDVGTPCLLASPDLNMHPRGRKLPGPGWRSWQRPQEWRDRSCLPES